MILLEKGGRSKGFSGKLFEIAVAQRILDAHKLNAVFFYKVQ